MERVTFLLEENQERLSCLLNPESLLIQRQAGVKQRRSLGSAIASSQHTDDLLIATGGGRMELKLDLLFDISIAGSSIDTEDVRVLTTPFWNLAENSVAKNNYQHPPLVRFIWGKSWNIPGFITAVAERLESFTANGTPTRSWLRMNLVRVQDTNYLSRKSKPKIVKNFDLSKIDSETSETEFTQHQVQEGDRIEQIAFQYYQNPLLWKALATYNQLDDPNQISSGAALKIPPLSYFEEKL